MASKVAICNRALIEIGANTIVSLSEDSEEARRCSVVYDECRQTILRDNPWNFATKQASLARLSTAPLFDFQYAYQLPSDCLRVMRTKDNSRHKIVGRTVHSDEESLYIEYIADIDDPNVYDGMFREALSLLIAYKLAYATTASTSMAQDRYQVYLNALSRARGVDAQEGTPPSMRPTAWLRAHVGSCAVLNSEEFTLPE